LRRGEIWTVAGGSGYAGKPRPAVIVQDDRFSGTHSVTLCALTSDDVQSPLLRLPVMPSATNGLRVDCQLMLDKVTTVPRARLGRKIGALDGTDLLRLNRGLVVFLGLAG
jgi:mRNA interferase MazF